MTSECTNLLPEERVRAFRQLYFLRIAVVSLLLASGVIIVHGVLLLPTYLYLSGAVQERTLALASLSDTLAGSEEQEIQARVAALSEDAAYLARLAETPKASAAVSAVMALPRPGVTLTGFSFAPSASGGATMALTGQASTRETLRAYEDTLKAASFVKTVDLPISAYAKERDIGFTVMLSGPFLP